MFSITRKSSQNAPANQPLSEWDPFRMMESLLRQDPFDGFISRRAVEPSFVPRFDVKETKDGFVFQADLPGIKDSDVEIHVTGNRLTISGKRDAEQQKDGENYYLYERTYGSFSRSFTLPDSADTDKVTANMKDGVLFLSIPKRVESQPRRVTIGK
jgi:HSP20 family protein